MARLMQVGAGSGGMTVLDMLSRDPRLTRVALIEPDIYKPHNVERHLFSPAGVGRLKAHLAVEWLRERRPDLEVRLLPCDLLDPAQARDIDEEARQADIGVCAADNEVAKYHFDALMRKHRKPWTLGEVLSGGIGGFIHWFVPGGPCYGCVASFLKRSVTVDKPAAPDYSQPGGPVAEVTVPAGRAAIEFVASLHALVTLDLLEHHHRPVAGASGSDGYAPGFTSLLFTLKRVPDIFEEAYRPYRFRVPRAAECLICRLGPEAVPPEELDVALDQALARLGDA